MLCPRVTAGRPQANLLLAGRLGSSQSLALSPAHPAACPPSSSKPVWTSTILPIVCVSAVHHSLQGGPYADVYMMWPSHPAAAAAVNAAAAALRTPPVTAPSHPAAITESTAATGTLPAAQQQASSLSLPSSAWSAGRLWGGGRRQEWALCFSSVPLRLSGRRKASVEGLSVVVPDNAEALLAGIGQTGPCACACACSCLWSAGLACPCLCLPVHVCSGSSLDKSTHVDSLAQRPACALLQC